MDGVKEPFDVLIVEDDLALLAFLVTRLEYESDLRVAAYATDGAEGLRLATELEPDIVLSDFDLPEIDGTSLVGSLRRTLPAAALVLYAAVWSESAEREAKLHGADACVAKGVAPSQIIATVRAAVTARRSVLRTAS